MAKHYVICKYCGIKFDRDSEPCESVGGRRYAHKECAIKYQSSLTQEQKDEISFYEYTKNLFKEEYNYVMTKKLAEQYVKAYNFTYSGMQKALFWFYEVKRNSLEKSNGSIGILPYIYNDAKDYYYRLYLAQIANNIEDIQSYKPEIVEIEIGSPRVRIEPPRLFKFDDEEE